MSEWRLRFRGTLFPVRAGELTLGRSNYASIVVNNPLSSREHALIRSSGGALEIVDLGSKNGTFVNGARLEGKVTLQPGDRIKIGTDLLEVLLASAEDPSLLGAATEPGRHVGVESDLVETDTTVQQQGTLELAERLVASNPAPDDRPATARLLRSIVDDLLGTARGLSGRADRERLRLLLAALEGWRLGGELDVWRAAILSRLS